MGNYTGHGFWFRKEVTFFSYLDDEMVVMGNENKR